MRITDAQTYRMTFLKVEACADVRNDTKGVLRCVDSYEMCSTTVNVNLVEINDNVCDLSRPPREGEFDFSRSRCHETSRSKGRLTWQTPTQTPCSRV